MKEEMKMSAYIVDKRTIDRVLNAAYFEDYIYVEPFENLRSKSIKDIDKLGQKLWNMNEEAVNQRYSDKQSCPKDYHFSLRGVCIEQGYQSACCLNYQCSEGNVPKKKLYKQLDEFIDALARKIANREAEKAKVEWK